MEQIKGNYEFLMEDGTMISTSICYGESDWITERRLNLLLQQMCEQGNMIVGFDTEWTSGCSYNTTAKVVLLKFCTQVGCVMIKLGMMNLRCVTYFLINKDIVFAGVHMKEVLKKLKRDYGIDIRNAVDLSELAASVLNQPRLVAYGVRGLASEVLLQPWKPSTCNIESGGYWELTPLSDEKIKCATVDTYAAYKIAKKLLG